jgi:hypothetical protein
MHRSLLAAALLSLAPLATAQVYKWTDAHGTTHYSEAPPTQSVKYKALRTPSSAEAPAGSASVATPRSTPLPAAAMPIADTPENRSALCRSLKANLATLQGTAPVVMQRDGQSVALDATERQQQAGTAQSQYRQYCQGK